DYSAWRERGGKGFVPSLAHPGGNLTGLSNLEPTLGAKWVDLLHEIAPGVKRVGFLSNPGKRGSMVTLQPAQVAAKAFSLGLLYTRVATPADIEGAIAELGREPNG